MNRISMENAEREAIELASMISPGSFYSMKDFPGMDALGLKNGQHNEDIADAIVYLCRAQRNSKRIGIDATEAYGRLVVMLQYGIVGKKEIEKAIMKASKDRYDED